MKLIVWGVGYIATEFTYRKSYHPNDEIIYYVDNNKNMWGKKFAGMDVISPTQLEQIDFDRLVICTIDYCDEIREQIKNTIKIGSEKIITYSEVEEDIKHKFVEKYGNCDDTEIQQILEYYKLRSLNIYGTYDGESEDVLYPVDYDKDGMPYISFEGKKMFFPKEYNFEIIGKKVFIKNILYEQGKHSPHLYLKSDYMIKDGVVIVDAGVCEGNFALRYIDKAKKVYLIESDPKWVDALKRTFAPYQDKVVICNQYLSGEDTKNTVTLDTLVKENIDILKMDIEGYETDALRGAKRVLQESNAYCAICSYHKHNDEKNIKKILKQYGYDISTSEGYMYFWFDADVELRRGIVYGQKMTHDGS